MQGRPGNEFAVAGRVSAAFLILRLSSLFTLLLDDSAGGEGKGETFLQYGTGTTISEESVSEALDPPPSAPLSSRLVPLDTAPTKSRKKYLVVFSTLVGGRAESDRTPVHPIQRLQRPLVHLPGTRPVRSLQRRLILQIYS